MKKIFIYLLPVIMLASCAKNLGDYNIDQKNPPQSTATSLFANALKQLTDYQTTPNVRRNVFRFWVQHWTATTYQDEPRYNFQTRNIPLEYWTNLYREVLQDLKEAKTLTETDASLTAGVKANRIAATEVASVYAWSVLVNTWGDIPYSEALGNVNQPKYDKGADIYKDLFKRLDAAITQFTPTAANFGSSDLLYHDNTAGWLKFAHSLRLKLAITVADVDDATAKAAIQASAANAFQSNADNATFQYFGSQPNNNPISEDLNPAFTSRQDYVAGITLTNMMNTLNDPRRPFYFTTDENGAYTGGEIGSNNDFAKLSQINNKIIQPSFEALLLDYPEVELILAEAAERWGIAGSAADHYTKAVTASILYWGGTTTTAATYLAQPAVAYATAPGNYKQKIGIQKYLALYNRGYDAWVEWKRLDYPALQPATDAISVLPLRLPYVSSEYTLNRANVAAASAAIGGDAVSTKIFWDKF